MENEQSVFFLSHHTPYGRVRLARGARKILTPRFTDFFTEFEKKTDCFAVYAKSKTRFFKWQNKNYRLEMFTS